MWFEENHMKANPDKFQLLLLTSGTTENIDGFNISNQTVVPERSVKTLGLRIGANLNFHQQVSILCAKAAGRIHALKGYLNS